MSAETTVLDRLLRDFEAEVANTRRLLEALPEDRFDWKPHERSWTLGALAGHVAEAAGWADAMLEDDFDFAAVARDYQPFVPKDRADLLEHHDKGVASFLETFRGRDDAFMDATWTMRNGDAIFLSMPRDAAVRATILHHVIHHRGQLTVYLRLLDVKVPSTYGPSADSAPI